MQGANPEQVVGIGKGVKGTVEGVWNGTVGDEERGVWGVVFQYGNISPLYLLVSLVSFLPLYQRRLVLVWLAVKGAGLVSVS